MGAPQSLTARGRGNLDWTFGLGVRQRLVGFRIHFNDIDGGAATTQADVTLSLDSASNLPGHDATLYTVKNRGLNADAHFRVPDDEVAEWTYDARDKLKLAWTNPDTDNLEWGAVVQLAPVEE